MPPKPSPSSLPDSAPRLAVAASIDFSCSHCGLPAPEAGGDSSSSLRFCCAGCRIAYATIHEAGLGAYYLYRGQANRAEGPALSSDKSYADYDSRQFAERHVRGDPEHANVELFLEGIHCGACIWLVERLPRALPGVVESRFDLGRRAVRVEFDPRRVKVSQIARTLDGFGYRPHPVGTSRNAGELERDRLLLTRLGVAGAIAGNVMLMALALYSGAFSGMDSEFSALFRWGSLALSVPSVFWCAGVFFQGAIAAVRTRTPHMDLPVSIAILVGFTRSAWNTISGRGEIYFDSIAVLVFLLLVGRWLQHRHHRRAAQAAELISALAPSSARCIEGDAYRELPLEALTAGSIVEVRADERMPADGVVTAGSGSVDTSWLTGESLPEDVAPGARVYAGTRNLSGTLRVRVEVSGAETRLGRLVRDVEAAQQRRAPIVRLADRIAGKFVLVVLGLSALTLGIWLFVDPARALDHAVALLVVTCPCALAMATPLAVSTALRRAAHTGILFKGGEFLEALARPATIAFDKTGTLTEGKLAVDSFAGDPEVKAWVRAAEGRSPHPIGRALVAAFAGEPELAADCVEEQPGAGVVAQVAGHPIVVGSAALIAGSGVALPDSIRARLDQHARSGRSAVAVAVDGRVRAVIAFSDALRSDAAHSLAELRHMGYDLAVLSGDRREVVQDVAQRLGTLREACGEMKPEDKLAWVENARRGGPVIMIGDGVNDAAAMAAADVGIAVHGGAEASLAAADAFTTEPGVHKVLEAVVGARRTLAVIRRGIAFSLAYNAVGVVLCLLGLISPLLAAVLMPLSSLTVVTSALHARTFESPIPENRR